MLSRKGLATIIFIIALAMLTACTDGGGQDGSGKDLNGSNRVEGQEETIMADFKQIGEKEDLNKIIGFVDENIKSLSRENATIMVKGLEEVQATYLEDFQERYFDSQVQENLLKAFNSGIEVEDFIEKIDDDRLVGLLKETKKLGYRIEMAEGSFFPIVDYGFYERYSSCVTEDMEEYINIRAIESTEVPARDAALVISWKELVNRAMDQENFINKYPESIRLEEVRELFATYSKLIFRGLDNTPLFDHVDNSLNEDAKKDYLEVIQGEENSKLIGKLKAFMELVERHDYRLTEGVDNFRKEAIEDLLNN